MHSDALRTATLQYPQAGKTQMYDVIIYTDGRKLI